MRHHMRRKDRYNPSYHIYLRNHWHRSTTLWKSRWLLVPHYSSRPIFRARSLSLSLSWAAGGVKSMSLTSTSKPSARFRAGNRGKRVDLWAQMQRGCVRKPNPGRVPKICTFKHPTSKTLPFDRPERVILLVLSTA